MYNDRIAALATAAAQHAWSRADRNTDLTAWEAALMNRYTELLIGSVVQIIREQSMNSDDEWEQGLKLAERAIALEFGI